MAQDEREPHGAAGVDAPDLSAEEQTDEQARLRAQVAEFEDNWKRSVAEFANYRRRSDQERSEFLRSANGTLIRDLLPVLDDLERALANLPTELLGNKWVEGVQLVERKFKAILDRQVVTAIDSIGQPFDPAIHEAVGGNGSHVAEEYQRGYRLHGRTLRPAMVLVGEAPLQTQGTADLPA